MRRHGYDLSLTHPWVGQVLTWRPTPWRAVQEAAWRALHMFARDYSLSEEAAKNCELEGRRHVWKEKTERCPRA